ncbi:putative Clp protease, ATP-binding subunit ClpX, Clp ATPase [Helianthus anomalus]
MRSLAPPQKSWLVLKAGKTGGGRFLNMVKLHFTEKALRLIGQKAMVKNTGARGLRAILETLLTDAMYEIPDVKTGNDRVEAVVIDEESVGSVDKPGCGGKILRGDGALDDLSSKDQV